MKVIEQNQELTKQISELKNTQPSYSDSDSNYESNSEIEVIQK